MLRALTSTILDRMGFASRAGLSFEGKRDLYTALGYPRKLSYKHYRDRYDRGDIAARISKAYPSATWAGGAIITEDPDPDIETPFELAVRDLFNTHSLWSKLCRADVLCQLGEYSILLIGAEGNLDTELSLSRGLESVLYFTPASQDNATIDRKIADTSDKRFGLPEYYQVRLSESVSRRVHWTRVIHLADNVLDNDLLGEPRLRNIWNRLDDLDKLVGGGSEAAWKRMDPGVQLDLNPEVELQPGDEDAMEAEIEEMLHGMRRYAQTRGVTMTPLNTQVVNFGPNAHTVLQLISGSTGIPLRILVGSERGELASTQDDQAWNDRIAERRREFAVPVLRDLLDRLIQYKALPQPDNYEVTWPEIDELDEDGKATVAGKLSKANRDQVESGGGLILTTNEIRSTVFDLDPIEQVTDIEQSVVTAAAAIPEWKRVHQAASRFEKVVASLFLSAWATSAAAINTTELDKAVESKDRAKANRIADAALDKGDAKLEAKLPDLLLDIVNAGGQAALTSTIQRGGFRAAAKFSMSFDAANPRSIKWAEELSSLLIVEIGEETRKGVKDLISLGITEGRYPRSLRRDVVQIVGLRSDQVTAVENLGIELRGARPGTVVERFPPTPGYRDRAGLRIKVPKNITEEWIAKQQAKYAKMSRDYRSFLISRTETLRSANHGQEELWLQAVDQGQLSADTEKEWIVTDDERLRDEHEAMRGQRQKIGEKFVKGDGTLIDPGEEPNCRCAQGIAE